MFRKKGLVMKKVISISLLFSCWVQPSFKTAISTHLTQNQIPSGFGRTHFIMGAPSQPHTQAPAQPAPQVENIAANARALFAPDDNIRKELIQLIDAEKESITLAVFILTDHEIADALVRAQKRGVDIELVTDSSCLRDGHNKIGKLCQAGCAVYVYNPGYDKQDQTSLMHHKFAVFKNNRAGNQIVWTGSFNFTKSGSTKNQENAVVLEDKQVAGLFEKNFGKLKERSYRYGSTKKI